MRQVKDPAPSRLAYRMNRLMLTPSFRRFLRLGLPVLCVMAGAAWWASDEGRRLELIDRVAEVRRQIEARPEFRISMMAVEGVDAELEREVRETLALDFPLSSFDLDLEAVRASVERLPAVLSAGAKLGSGGVLVVDVTPREAVAVWRTSEGLRLVDDTGKPFASLERRKARPDLPLIAGDGAEKAVSEALALNRAAQPLSGRLRGFLRVGERRWDVILDRDQRVMLPEDNSVLALEKIVALDSAQDLLARDVTRIDFRNRERPVLRMGMTALGGGEAEIE